MSDQMYLLIFRLLHIVCGVFWAGSVFYTALFIIPAAKASGPEGTKFMQQLGKTKYPIFIMIAAIITIFAGLMIMWKLSGGFEPAWFSAPYAQVLSTGSILAIIAFIIGFTVNRPAAIRMEKIGKAVEQAGVAPTAEQMKELMMLRNRLFKATNFIAVLLAITVISMSIFRYVS